jgi:hypothetical protein
MAKWEIRFQCFAISFRPSANKSWCDLKAHMWHGATARLLNCTVLLSAVLLLAGCSIGVKKMAPLPAGMTSFNNPDLRLKFMLPPGWEAAPPDPGI